jgi:hypothetical protein
MEIFQPLHAGLRRCRCFTVHPDCPHEKRASARFRPPWEPAVSIACTPIARDEDKDEDEATIRHRSSTRTLPFESPALYTRCWE